MTRLDQELVRRGLVASRTRAARLIAAGKVTLDGAVVSKSSTIVDESSPIEVFDDRFVSRAAHKLEHALTAFEVPVAGRCALDIGASTGGFTQVLCLRGAKQVVALDVGHGQLVPEVANDERVVNVEGFNIRDLNPDVWPSLNGSATPPGLITGDLSFISLRFVFPVIAELMDASSDAVLLFKPQFEVGRGVAKGGVVRSGAERSRAAVATLQEAWRAGLYICAVELSPIQGMHGNYEYLWHLRLGAQPDQSQWLEILRSVTEKS